MTRGVLAGFERALIFYTDSSGRHIGSGGATLSNGSTSGAYVASDVVAAGLAPVNQTDLDIRGGDKTTMTIQFGNAKVGGFDLVISAFDDALNDMVSDSTKNTTNSYATQTSENPNKTAPKVLGLALQQRFTLFDGTMKYLTRIFPRNFMRIKQGGMNYQAESDTIIRVTPVMTNKAFSGQVFGSTGLNLNLEGDITDNYNYITANPVHFVTFVGDGSGTTFSTIYKPISNVVTLNATPNSMWKNATATALSAITLAGAVTLAAAGSAGDVHVLAHETAYVPV